MTATFGEPLLSEGPLLSEFYGGTRNLHKLEISFAEALVCLGKQNAFN